MRSPFFKLLIHLRHGLLLLQLSIELVAPLNVRLVFASNELLSWLAYVRWTRISISLGERYLSELWIFRLPRSGAYFYRK